MNRMQFLRQFKLSSGGAGVTGLAIALGLAGVSADAATLRVPNQYPTIQAAIDAAGDGDRVMVFNGTYTGAGNTDLDFGGKAITVRSKFGANHCIIDCEGAARASRRSRWSG